MKINLRLISRNLAVSFLYQLLSLAGLVIAFSCVFTIVVWLLYEFSYDRFHPEYQRTYRLTFETTTSGNTLHFARCWEPWISRIPEAFPQVEELVRLEPYRHTAIKIAENKFYSDRVFAVDSNFFKVFGVRLNTGNPERILGELYSAIISKSIADKCFGNKDPVGQTLLLSGEYDTKMTLFTIRGVMSDTPPNAHIHFDILTSYARPTDSPPWAYVYLVLKRNTNPEDVLAGLPSFIKQVAKEDPDRKFIPHLQKIADIHLFSDKDREAEPNGNIGNVILLGTIALALLLISFLNYYNTNRSRIPGLARQIHVQRIAGAGSFEIISNTVIESALIVFVAVFIALLLSQILTDLSEFSPGNSLLSYVNSSPGNLIFIIILIALFTIISGSLPVILFVLNPYRFTADIKANPVRSGKRYVTYGILLAIQFFFAIILLIAAFTIYRQKEFMLGRGIGSNESGILVFSRQNWEIRFKYNAFREEAIQNPLIKDFTAAMEEPTGETVDALEVESPDLDPDHQNIPLYVLSVEDNFLDFFNLKLVAGRDFSPYNPERKSEDYILNETAVKKLGWKPEEAVGSSFKIKFDTPGIFYGGKVVGVVRDFNYTSLKQEIKPYVLFQKPIFYLCYLVKVDSARKYEAIGDLKRIWEKILPDYPFQYEFLGDLYASVYRKEIVQSKLTSLFSILALLIICIGLITVTSVLLVRRTKEIGIRKVNGATVPEIVSMFLSFYLRWFALAFITACPVALIIVNKWLQNFMYRTDVKWWMFPVAGSIVLSVTLITVIVQTLKAAGSNPAEAIRYE
jgi:putative ABC transport system permease protein